MKKNLQNSNRSVKYFPFSNSEIFILNNQLIKKALEKCPNPHILINTISRRIRQLGTSGGGTSRPLIDEASIREEKGKGVADTALLELIHGKIAWEEIDPETEQAPKER